MGIEYRIYTEIAKNYDIHTNNGDVVGQQYLSDTVPLDELANLHERKNNDRFIALMKYHFVFQVQRSGTNYAKSQPARLFNHFLILE